MTPSDYNIRIKKVWGRYVEVAGDPTLPSPTVFCSSYIRKVWVTAVHPTGDRTRMAEVASHMSHNLTTAEKHYDTSGQLETTSRSTDHFRHLMFEGSESVDGSVAGKWHIAALTRLHQLFHITICHSVFLRHALFHI